MISLTCIILLGICCMACAEVNPNYTAPQDGEQEPIDRTAFAKGADISWTTQMEHEGIKFRNTNGDETECTALMKQIGMNAIRLRVWVNPAEGWNNKGDVVAKALRARDLGMRLMIDFHYSDTWADPGHQTTPAAWADYDIEQLKQAVADHTTDVLSTLKNYGIDVEWVQVGNETSDGMLWPLGRCSEHPQNYTALSNAGYDAVKAVYPDSKVIVHLHNGNGYDLYSWLFGELKKYNGKYDLVGMSLYPGTEWQDSTHACVENITKVRNAFGCNVMICEVGMPWDDAPTAKAMLSYLITQSKATGYCEGVFYWEPQAPAGYNDGYLLGAFADEKPTEALDAFKE